MLESSPLCTVCGPYAQKLMCNQTISLNHNKKLIDVKELKMKSKLAYKIGFKSLSLKAVLMFACEKQFIC